MDSVFVLLQQPSPLRVALPYSCHDVLLSKLHIVFVNCLFLFFVFLFCFSLFVFVFLLLLFLVGWLVEGVVVVVVVVVVALFFYPLSNGRKTPSYSFLGRIHHCFKMTFVRRFWPNKGLFFRSLQVRAETAKGYNGLGLVHVKLHVCFHVNVCWVIVGNEWEMQSTSSCSSRRGYEPNISWNI